MKFRKSCCQQLLHHRSPKRTLLKAFQIPCVEAVGGRYHPLAVDETGIAFPSESFAGVVS